jgi:uncharacterized membrane protein
VNILNKVKQAVLALVFGVMVLAGVGESAFAVATPIDVTSVTDQVTASLTPIGLIGLGVLLVFVALKTYKWIRRAM